MQNLNIKHPDLEILVAVHTLIVILKQTNPNKLNHKRYGILKATLTPNLTYALVCKVFFAQFIHNWYAQHEEIKSEHFNLQKANTFDKNIKTQRICQLEDDISMI